MTRTLKLDKMTSIEIKPTAPFNFNATVFKSSRYIFEDIFWQRKQGKKIPWLEKEIRL